MNTVAIVGVGLIGGSFALALKKAGFSGRIFGVSSDRTIAEAMRLGVIDEGASLESAEAEADLIYLAQPILQILDLLPRLRPKPGAFVTDAGSTKARIVATAKASLAGCQFVGGHPMAGKETRGVAAADADLFRGRNYVVTPSEDTPALRWFLRHLELFGAKVQTLEADEHDRLVAFTSHLPQILSTALAETLEPVLQAPKVAGPALLDMTRIAQSPFDMWHDIFLTNREPILQALTAFLERFDEARKHFDSPEFAQAFERAEAVAKSLRQVKELE